MRAKKEWVRQSSRHYSVFKEISGTHLSPQGATLKRFQISVLAKNRTALTAASGKGRNKKTRIREPALGFRNHGSRLRDATSEVKSDETTPSFRYV